MSVKPTMAGGAERNQVLFAVVAALTPAHLMMHL
jgi:hypothetical protein